MAANVLNAGSGFLFWTAAARLYQVQEVGLAAATVSAVGLLAMLGGVFLAWRPGAIGSGSRSGAK